MAAVQLQGKSVCDLDQLVSDYLVFRKFNDASKLTNLRKNIGTSKADGKFAVSSRILTAFDDGDYSALLSLWETFIVQPQNEALCLPLTRELKATEFLCNLHCAVYPFRPEVMRRVGKHRRSWHLTICSTRSIVSNNFCQTFF